MKKNFSDICSSIRVMKGKILQQINKIGFKCNYFSEESEVASRLGIGSKYRNESGEIARKLTRKYRINDDTTALRSKASSMLDDWSVPGEETLADGGGTQYFVPDNSLITNF